MAIVVDANYIRKVADGLDQSDPRTFKLAASLIGLDVEFKAYAAANAGADVATWLGSLAGTGGASDTDRFEAIEAAVAALQGADTTEADARTAADNALQGEVDALETLLANETTARTEADTELQSAIDAITATLAADDTTLDTAQERIDRIKSLIAAVESLEIADVSGLQAALDAAGGTSTLRALTLTPAAAESPTPAELVAALPAGTKPGDIVSYTTPRQVVHRYDVVAGPAVVRRPGNWVYDDTLPDAADFRPGDAFRFLDPQGRMRWVRVNAAGAIVIVDADSAGAEAIDVVEAGRTEPVQSGAVHDAVAESIRRIDELTEGRRWSLSVMAATGLVTGTGVAGLNEAIQLLHAAGGGVLVVSESIDVPADDWVRLNAKSHVELEAASPGVQIRASGVLPGDGVAGDKRTRLILTNSSTTDCEIRGFGIRLNGLVTSYGIELTGTRTILRRCDISDMAPTALYDARVAVYADPAQHTVRSCPLVATRAGAVDCALIDCHLHDCYHGVSCVSGSLRTRIERVRFDEYSGRGISVERSPTTHERDMRILDPVFGAPATVAKTITGVIRQPVAFQDAGSSVGQRTEGLIFRGAFIDVDPAPFIATNPNDSPGEGSNRPSHATADVFSFNRVRYAYIEVPIGRGSGEVGLVNLSQGSSDNVVFGGASRDSDLCSVNVGVANDKGNEDTINKNNTIIGVVSTNDSIDVNHDHNRLAPLRFVATDGLALMSCRVESDIVIPAPYDPATTYATGDRVVDKPASSDGAGPGLIWVSLVDGNAGNPLVEGASWEQEAGPRPLKRAVYFEACTRVSMAGCAITRNTVYDSIEYTSDCTFEALELNEVLSTNLPTMLSRNGGRAFYVSDIGKYQLPDGAGGWTDAAGGGETWYADVDATGGFTAGTERRGIASVALTTTGAYEVLTDADIPASSFIGAFSKGTGHRSININLDTPNARRIVLNVTNQNGAAANAAMRIQIRI